MFNGFRWGGISVRGLIRTLLPDVWMVIAVMIIAYLAIGIVGPVAYTPEYEVNTIVAVYPDNKLSAADSSSERIDAAAAVNGMLGSSAMPRRMHSSTAGECLRIRPRPRPSRPAS